MVTQNLKLPDMGRLAELLAESYLPGERPTAREYRSSGAGGRGFVALTASGSEEAESLTGIVLSQSVARAFYMEAYAPGSDQAPDCASEDGLHGDGNPGGECLGCTYNQWGSGGLKGRGKACTEYRRVYILPIDGSLPIVLRITPTGLGAWSVYRRDEVLSKGLSLHQVITVFALRAEDGQARLSVSCVGRVPIAQMEGVRQVAGVFGAFGDDRRIRQLAPDYLTSGEIPVKALTTELTPTPVPVPPVRGRRSAV